MDLPPRAWTAMTFTRNGLGAASHSLSSDAVSRLTPVMPAQPTLIEIGGGTLLGRKYAYHVRAVRTASAKARGASCGRLCPALSMTRCS